MTPPPTFQPELGPIYDLRSVQQDAQHPDFRVPEYLIRQVRESLGDLPKDLCIAHIRRVVGSLTLNDFAGVATWPDTPSGLIRADVYGKQDEHGNWYVKVAVHQQRVRIYSCHHLESDLVLRNKNVLRKMP